MKTVCGKVVSSQRISLSKAAKLISRFTASDNEASPAFAAYLRRTSAAFNELVQLHKEYKIPLGEVHVKKDHSSGFVTEGTANSVKIAGERIKRDGVNVDGVSEGTVVSVNVNRDSRNVKDEAQVAHDAVSIEMGMDVQVDKRSFNGNVSDVRGVSSKKKKRSAGDVAIAVKNQPSGEHDAITVNDVKNEMGIFHGSEMKNVPDVGGVGKKSNKKSGSDGKMSNIDNGKPHGDHDAINVGEVNNKMGSLDGSEKPKNILPDVGGVDKKSKKKRGGDGHVAIIYKDQPHDAVNVTEVKNEMGSPCASEETKKKKKRDKHEKENHVGTLETLKEVQLCPPTQDDGVGETADTAQNNGVERKKHKKGKVKEVNESSLVRRAEQKDDGNVRNEVKEERESCSIRSSEQRCERNVENKDDVCDVVKKQSHGAEERENGRNSETEATVKKASHKRKRERVADGELDGSQEPVRSKKKKYEQ